MKSLANQRSVRVVFEPEADGGWHVHVPAVQGCRSQGRSIAEARARIREALATCTDVFDDAATAAATVNLDEDIKLPAPMRCVVQRIERAREQAVAAKAIEAEGARELTARFSLRDVGELLGFSPEGVRRIKAG